MSQQRINVRCRYYGVSTTHSAIPNNYTDTLLHTSQLLKQLCTLGDVITGVAVVLVSSNTTARILTNLTL